MRSTLFQSGDFSQDFYSRCGEYSAAILFAEADMTPYPSERDEKKTKKNNDSAYFADMPQHRAAHIQAMQKPQKNERDNLPLRQIKS